MVAHEENVSWIDLSNLVLEITTTGLDFTRLRCTVIWRSAFDSVSNIDSSGIKSSSDEGPIQKLTSWP